MKKKKQFNLMIPVIILFIFTQIMHPITSIGTVNASEEVSKKKLFQTVEEIELEEGLTIKEDTYLYGEILDGEVSVQYTNTYTTLSLDSVVEINELEYGFPDYHEVDEYHLTGNLPKDISLFSLEPNNEERLRTKIDIDYLISENELGLEVIYFGNIEYYLSEEDRLLVEETKTNDKETPIDTPQEENAESDNKEDPSEDPSEVPIEDEGLDVGITPEDTPIVEGQTSTESKTAPFSGQAPSKSEPEAKPVNLWANVSANYFKVIEDELIVYNKGNTKKIGTLTKGQVYPIKAAYGPNWHAIQFGTSTGYVYKPSTEPDDGKSLLNVNRNYKQSSRSFVTLQDTPVYDNSRGGLEQFGTISKGEKYRIVSDYGSNWFRVIFADRVGYVLKSNVRQEFTGGEKFFQVLTSNLPVFDNRSGSLKQVGSLTKGQVYEIVSDYGNWHRIRFNDHYGYVYKADTQPNDGRYIRNKNTSYKQTNRSVTALRNVIVYDNSGGTLRGFGTINKGQTYKITSDYGNWWRIVFADRVGYIHKNQVKYNFSKSDKHFKVLIDNLAVYENRGSGLVKVGELKKGQTYPRVSDYGNWHRVRFGDGYGFVYTEGTQLGNKSAIRNLNGGYKNSRENIRVNRTTTVYDNASGKLIPFSELEKGTVFPIATDYGNWWRIIYLDRVGYVHKNSVQLYGRYSYTDYGLTLNQAVDIQMELIKDYHDVSRSTLKSYLNVNNFINDPVRRFQFLDLTKPTGASISLLNNYLKGKGTLNGLGKAFSDASRTHQINELYLVSHAILETGHGTSKLASGIDVGKDRHGKLYVVNNTNRKYLTHIKTTYNMFGIGAYNSCPEECGAKRAYELKWFTPAAAVTGGAEWIKGDYIYNQYNQNTLYKMRWNPEMVNGSGWKQYATDPGWASKQSRIIYDLHEALRINRVLDFNVSQYKN